jgi:hypothetical protein
MGGVAEGALVWCGACGGAVHGGCFAQCASSVLAFVSLLGSSTRG